VWHAPELAKGVDAGESTPCASSGTCHTTTNQGAMRQTLFYIPAELYSWPVFGFGLLLAVWLIACVIILITLVRRQGFNADTQSYLPVMLGVAAVIAFGLPILCEPRGLPIRGYGMMILLAVLSALGLAIWRAQRCGINPDAIFTLAFWMILPGILGARIFFVAEYWFENFWPAFKSANSFASGVQALLFQVCNVANGGLVVYGAFIGGALGIILYRRKHSIPLLATLDLVAPSVLLGASIGRIGCLLNGCCYGGDCDLPWKVTFPWNSPVYTHQVYDTHELHPLGIELGADTRGRPVVVGVDADSPAARAGLKAGVELLEINGVLTDTVKDARMSMLQIDKLCFAIKPDAGKPNAGLPFTWLVDDPPSNVLNESDSTTRVAIPIYGFAVSGKESDRPVISSVVPQTPEAVAGLRAGQRILSVSGISVDTVGELADLLQHHRQAAWLRLKVSGSRPLIDIDVPRPMPRSLAVHPTQLYSSIDALLLCLLLLAYDNFRRRDGELAALTMTFYPIARTLVEWIRTDEPAIWGTGLHISQLVSIVILLIGISIWIYIFSRPAEMAFARPVKQS